jgi:hypothetical protein
MKLGITLMNQNAGKYDATSIRPPFYLVATNPHYLYDQDMVRKKGRSTATTSA